LIKGLINAEFIRVVLGGSSSRFLDPWNSDLLPIIKVEFLLLHLLQEMRISVALLLSYSEFLLQIKLRAGSFKYFSSLLACSKSGRLYAPMMTQSLTIVLKRP